MRIRTVAICTAMLLAGCTGSKLESGKSPEEVRAAASAFVETYFNSYFRFNPSEGTAAGFHQYDAQLENRAAPRIRARVTELQTQASQVAELQKSALDPQYSVDLTLIANRIGSELLDLGTLRTWRSPLYYAGTPGSAVDQLIKRNFAPPESRLESVTARLKQVPALIDAMRDNTREPPKEFTDLSIRIVKGSIPFFRNSVSQWAETAAGNNSALLNDFSVANRKALASMEVMARHLEENVSLLSTGSYAIGPENFAKKLRLDEMAEIPLDKLLAIGEARLQQDHKAFIEVARHVAPGKNPREAMAVLEAQHPSEADLMNFAKGTVEAARQFVIAKQIIPIPSEDLPRIEPTPAYARSGSFASMDTPGAFESSAKEAFYYVTPPEKDWKPGHKEEHLRLYNRPVMDMITVHEAYPGHYVQFLYVKQFPTRTRKLIYCGSNVEGWAHYAEQMVLEEGFGSNDPKIRLAQLSEALVRDARYVAGIRLHTSGWSVEQATKLFEEEAFMQPANAFEEARRGTYNPTYLYYTLGKMQIYKLREDYKKARGAGYSLAKFHEEFVKQGGIPVRLIRGILLPGNTESDL
ncbi:MAG: DUF885 domain-containing protein [Bryobacteraceae bacterium]|nr:DUF885 domain-containing protein [Bryobacteraceae bacterium]